MDLSQIYNEIITEYSRSTDNKKQLENPSIAKRGVNPSCGDDLSLALNIENGIITQAAFTGVGCAISQASAAIMTALIENKTIENAKYLTELFIKMIHKTANESELETLEDAAALQNIANMPARVKCAVLAWHTLNDAIQDYENA